MTEENLIAILASGLSISQDKYNDCYNILLDNGLTETEILWCANNDNGAIPHTDKAIKKLMLTKDLDLETATDMCNEICIAQRDVEGFEWAIDNLDDDNMDWVLEVLESDFSCSIAYLESIIGADDVSNSQRRI